MKFLSVVLLLIVAGASPSAAAIRLVEPKLRLDTQRSGNAAGTTPRVALTLDACSGSTDPRILSALVDNAIPATVFVTARWLRRNAPAFAVLRAHPDLFEIENHGAAYIPAIDQPVSVYGIAAAGSADAVVREVAGGADAIVAQGVSAPHWFRGATAKYSLSSIALLRGMGYSVAGYSVNGDGGSLLGASMAEKRIASARDGDVIIAHINQPTHSAGAGVVRGILDLKAKGYDFVRLDQATEDGSDATTN